MRHLGNCPNSAELPRFTQQETFKIYHSSTRCLWNPLTLNGKNAVFICISPFKNLDSRTQYKFEDRLQKAETGFSIFWNQSWLPVPKNL